MKDLHEFSAGGHDVPYGQGVSNIPAVLDELKRQGFKGNISIEYEYNWDNSVSRNCSMYRLCPWIRHRQEILKY
jgi:sugar phosphate isomerase/epimerase